MLPKKGIYLILFLFVTLLIPSALDRCMGENSTGTLADGTAPPAPPIPWSQKTGEATVLQADGTAPPAPPIHWRHLSSNA
jgi:hypothetical protein